MFRVQNRTVGALLRHRNVWFTTRLCKDAIATTSKLAAAPYVQHRSVQRAQQQQQYSSSSKTKPSIDTTKAASKKPEKKYVLSEKYASFVRKLLAPLLPLYRSQNIGKSLYHICSTCPGYQEFWLDECRLPDTLQTWFSTSSLYVWMMMARIRADPNAKHYNQGLIDSFFGDAERKIRQSGIKSGRIVNDTLKDLMSSFKGTVMSLDQGFASSDAVLAAAIWRNLLPEDDMVLQIDSIARFVRSQLAALDKCSIDDLIARNFAFQPVHP
ncbi:Ubiquinol cytochrome-c reductase assembly protein Cbp3 [Coemansia sp. RSA 1200]|nr:Ubiquinol cytochrome-c reductase assembly protein Cbp3 [Coemansia sp. RSA 1200]